MSTSRNPRGAPRARITIASLSQSRSSPAPSREMVQSAIDRLWTSLDEHPELALAESQALRRDASVLEDASAVARATLNVGMCRFLLLDFSEAILDINDALILFRTLKDEQWEAAALNALGKIHFRMNDYQTAVANFGGALSIRRRLGDRQGEAGCLNNLGLVQLDMARYMDAHTFHTESLRIHESVDNLPGAAIAMNNLGLVYQKLGDNQEALRCHERSLEIKRRLGNLAGVSASANNMGQLYRALGDYERALEWNREGLRIATEIHHRYNEAQAWINIGETLQVMGDLTEAMECFERGVGELSKAGDKFAVAETLIRMGENLARRSFFEEAFDHLTKALAISEELGLLELVGRAHLALSSHFEGQGIHDKALVHYRLFHDAQTRMFAEEYDNRRKVLSMQAEVERIKADAELHRLRNVELANAYEDLQRADHDKDELLESLRTKTEELDRLAWEDGLTGLANRRHLDKALAMEVERARRFGHPITVAMIDIDLFKQINDERHHQVGDEVLRTVARLLKAGCRSVDVVGRYGGEEFLLIMVETAESHAVTVCEKLRRTVELHDWSSIDSGIAVTVSIGVASTIKAITCEGLVALADDRLYQAKIGGRNRVCGA